MSDLGKVLLQSRSYMLIAVLVFATSALFFPPLIWAAAVLIALATLVLGPQEGFMILGFAAIPIVGFVLASDYQHMLVFLLFNLSVVWFLASILSITRSWSLVLSALVCVGVLMVVAVIHFLPGVLNLLAMAVDSFLKEMQKTREIQITADQLKLVTHVSLGYYVFDLMLSCLLALLITRGWQAKLYNPGGLSKEFSELRPDTVTILLLCGVGVSAMLGVDMAVPLLPVTIFPFVFSGFSAVQRAMVKNPNRRVAYGFYCLSCLFLLYIVLPGVLLNVIS